MYVSIHDCKLTELVQIRNPADEATYVRTR